MVTNVASGSDTICPAYLENCVFNGIIQKDILMAVYLTRVHIYKNKYHL